MAPDVDRHHIACYALSHREFWNMYAGIYIKVDRDFMTNVHAPGSERMQHSEFPALLTGIKRSLKVTEADV